MESPKRYHPALVTLHWLMAVLVFLNLYMGIFVFEDRGGGVNFQTLNTLVAIHMAVGVTIIVLLLARFVLRLRTGHPDDANAGRPFLSILSKVVHYGLYLTVLAATVLGLAFSLQSGCFQTAFLGAKSQFGPPPGAGFPPPGDNPGVQQGVPQPGTITQGNDGSAGQVPGSQGGDARRGGFRSGGPGGFFSLLRIHELAAYLLLALVGLHVAAALYHQILRKDNLLARMGYGQRA